ncbi:serine acetyltransferase [Flavobacterium sp. WLB]|uniref:Serine acetyltransferase n=1 Tax=Flavobacterium panici TaxID=2654843 RepID=A0A9N8J3W3_9FLAO|nr:MULTISPECIES: serine O-acetyltransferase EpsC [Flavobacterium]KOP38400.1 serine acetyltransferase [Flavobacterium sp. VMW]OWU89992.1 serine acetyltransferase [Flavobacterium sp. NLM]PUU68229.1 serine acetyltransferase [Flavobacterium sp. WLB]CAC9975086.1 serine acetyltransferase [Flavobacterium panici]
MNSFYQEIARQHQELLILPEKKLIHQFIDELFSILFSNTSKSYGIVAIIENKFDGLEKQFDELVLDFAPKNQNTKRQTETFFEALPYLHKKALNDAQTIFAKDPAAKSLEEVLYSYPGFFAIAVYRFSHQLWKQDLKLLARTISEYAHIKTSIEIHPGAKIGNDFAIDHGTGIVIGETTIIGNNVQIYQGVTLGALSVKKEEAFIKRHPTIEDNVIIYANSTILGGQTTVGRDSIIGGNVWLTYSVPSNSVVYHKNEMKVKDNNPFPEPIFYSI